MDERQDVVDHWRDAKSWIVPPGAVASDLLGGGGAGLELLIGNTCLGNLLTLLDREEVPEIHKHLFGCASSLASARGPPFGRSPTLCVVVVWVGRAAN
jgi:hypothetical protein